MNIAVVTETFYPFRGGSAKRYLEVMKRIARMGNDVTVYTVRLKNNWSVEEELDGIYIVRTRAVLDKFITPDGMRNLSQVAIYTGWILKQLIDEEYDLIEVNHCPIFPALISKLSSIINHTPLSVTFHEVWHNHWHYYVDSPFLAAGGIILEYLTMKVPDRFIAVSRRTADRLVKCFGVSSEDISIIPNGVDLKLFDGIKVDNRGFKIVYVGRMNPHKRVDLLIDAYAILKREYPGLVLELIGEGPARRSYERYAEEKNIDGIYFKGALSDEALYRSLKEAIVYVLPSIREGQSITTLEAMAAGTPQVVVSADGTAAPDMVAKSRSGLIVRPRAEEIAGAIKLLLNDEEMWMRMSENGLRFVRMYSWDSIAEMHLKHYKFLLRKYSRR